MAPKDKLTQNEIQGPIYSINCDNCREEYVGETERPLRLRMKEHVDSVEKRDIKSALGKHTAKTGHSQYGWEHTDIIDSDYRLDQRKIKEAIHIRLRRPQLNLIRGYQLPDIYVPLLREANEGGRTRSSSRTSGVNNL